ncbi:beta-1,4 N-acetylgalactosaminyltransferase 1 isoform X2 [Rhinatrema bivittatum]|nr:beta-1,4 N-acetylgalactosaminyltransferase 1 isoform X2 [Rhinatrema bivittatum]XP_029450776.1 beta-1,4 N-acetylgalactosaminyltransferase 1 isoform X2 [Rhinatrema bivittatum]XP_029450777.1 beta-1,4 N-acetylgalactosaminyltransferase 1 isoform X2 [Rhinatrema bivittatum]
MMWQLRWRRKAYWDECTWRPWILTQPGTDFWNMAVMRLVRKSLCIFLAVTVSLAFLVFHVWSPKLYSIVDRGIPEDLLDSSILVSSKKYAHLSVRFKEEVLRLLPKNSCSCELESSLSFPLQTQLLGDSYVIQLSEDIASSDLAELTLLREQEYQNHRLRTQSLADKLIIAKANSPLEYPVQGVEVRPLQTILVPGLRLEDAGQKGYRVHLSATMGTFNVAAVVDNVKVTGEGEMRLSLSSPRLDNLNQQLQFITYTNVVFHPNTADAVQLETDGHQATFVIKIRYAPTLKLYNPGSSGPDYNVSALVSILTKTFLRYDKLRALISSIRRFYPTVSIIIADDNEHPEKVEGPFIEQYFMPFGKGWFAGRNLAISQATTKYFLWVDDDFIFSPRTKVEKLVEVLEKTTLDLVGGAVREITGFSTTFRQKISIQPGGKDGDCLSTRRGHHHGIKGFPNCVVTDGVVNFFLARTDKAMQVGFDPRLRKVAHLEFFIDGLGILHVGSCDDVVVDHASKIKIPWMKSKKEKQYDKFRYPEYADNSIRLKHQLFYFKNRFQCLSGN